jgi:hypothetical protein
VAFDVKLKSAMAEIEAIIRKYDIGGFVTLGSKTHGEFEIFYPKWGLLDCEKMPNGQQMLKVKIRKAQPELTDSTIAFLLNTRDTCLLMAHNLQQVEDGLRKQVEFDHVPLHEFETEEKPSGDRFHNPGIFGTGSKSSPANKT